MKNVSFRLTMAAIVISIFCWFAAAQPAAKANDSMIVSTEWLAQHLNDDALVLLHVGDQKEY